MLLGRIAPCPVVLAGVSFFAGGLLVWLAGWFHRTMLRRAGKLPNALATPEVVAVEPVSSGQIAVTLGIPRGRGGLEPVRVVGSCTVWSLAADGRAVENREWNEVLYRVWAQGRALRKVGKGSGSRGWGAPPPLPGNWPGC